MGCYPQTSAGGEDIETYAGSLLKNWLLDWLRGVAWLFAITVMSRAAIAQVSVLTAHNDIARTGQNLNETILTPSNVNATQFGQLFSHPVSGGGYAQPLYVPHVAFPVPGTNKVVYHNVVYVATNLDFVYAFDADNNGGINAGPLWSLYLPGNTYLSNGGVVGTPVIDPSSDTMYLASKETQGSTSLVRLHAL